MKPRRLSLLSSCLLLLALLSSCAPAKVQSVPTSRPGNETNKAGEAATGQPAPTVKSTSEAPKYGGTLTAALKLVTPHFDMLQETSGSLLVPLASAYNLLIQHDPLNDFRIGPDLAKSWDISSDGLNYVFSLSEGVKFHHGRAMTSEDVKFNFERILNPPRGTVSPRKELYRNVSRIDAPDAKTLRIALKEPQASFLTLAALPYNFIFDPEVVRQKGDMKKDVMGTGPFKLLDYVQGVSVRLQKNADYFVKGRPYLDGVTFYTIADEMTRSAAIRTKQVLILPVWSAVSTGLSLQIQKTEPNIVLQKRTPPGMGSLIPNTKVAPWNDVRVRQALNLAIDREAAGRFVRDFSPGYSYMPPGSPWGLPKDELAAMPGNRQPKDQEIAEAKKLLAEVGYPQGLELAMLGSVTVYDRETGEVAQAQLARIGVNLRVQPMESGSWKQRIYEGTFSLASFPDSSAVDDPDIVLGEYYLAGSPKNYGAWANPKFDELYAAPSKALDPEKRKQMIWEMLRILHREVPRVIVVWQNFYAASWPEVKDWHQANSHFLGNSLERVWLAK